MSILDSKRPLHWYVVTDVHAPEMADRLHVGQRLLWTWHGKTHTSTLVDLKDGAKPYSGWTVVHERKVEDDELAEMRAKRTALAPSPTPGERA